VDWIGLAQDRNRWRALVNSVLNLGFHEMLGNYRVASRVVFSSIELVSSSSSSSSSSSPCCIGRNPLLMSSFNTQNYWVSGFGNHPEF
jgi:hypothetical protein